MIGTIDILRKFIAPFDRKIKLMIRRCVLKLLTDEKPGQVVQITMYDGECRDEVERVQDYGISTYPLPGAIGVVGCLCGDNAYPVVLKMENREYRPTNLQKGDVIIYTDKNKNEGHCLRLESDGRKIIIKCKDLKIDADNNIEINAGGKIDITAAGDITQQGANIRLN